MNWTETQQQLIKNGIAAERLPEEWQVGIDLSEANLSEANLSEADLSRADLSRADLSRANLSRANLSGADLSGTDLSEADLRGADLSRAIGPFTTGSFGQHTAIAAGGYIAIGCERHDYEWWLSNYEACGQRNDYTPEEIADYGAWIQLAVARQRRIEQQPEMSPDDLRDEADRQS